MYFLWFEDIDEIMDGSIKKIIIITIYPFNQRDFDRFGIEILRRNSFNVEIWDISSCLNKVCKDKLGKNCTHYAQDIRIFKEKAEIVNAISLLDNHCIINCFVEYSLRTFFIYRAISKYHIRYCVLGMVSFPNPTPIQTHRVERAISILKKGSSLKIHEIIQHILNKILLDFYFVFGIEPASIILLAGEKSSGKPVHPVNETTSRLWTHMLDYDIFLKQKNEHDESFKNKGVFLDQYLPRHPDFINLGISFSFSPDDYYPKLCNFFKKLEKKIDSDIVIAAHPRSDYGDSTDCFCGRSIIKGKTDLIVKEALFVIAHTSTAINFAVLYNKPIIFITTTELQKMISGKNLTGLYIQAIASELGKKPIDIDNISHVKCDDEMKINEDAYRRYKNLYIKKEGTPEKPVWEIFSSYLLHENSP
jgi:hypothetical protein